MSPEKDSSTACGPEATESLRLVVAGRVQGVGFRPFVYRLANALGLGGWVRNCSGQVEIHLQGPASALEAFERRLLQDAPPLARPRIVEQRYLPDGGEVTEFRILPSDADSRPEIHLPPDYFCCDDCLAELRDPAARRYRYPFINCTQCGPRYTLIERLPYDRPNTSMAGFPLCADCQAEYQDPLDRRFHAEPLACAVCGPELSFEAQGEAVVGNEPALARAVEQLRQGRILAVKGVGGYHLVCDACNDLAVQRLRRKKFRPHKPLAVLFPWAGEDGLAELRRHLVPDAEEARAVTDPSRPIVLIRQAPGATLSSQIAPGLGEIGAMLPYSPLHHLLAQDFGGPLVATSANLSGEPVLTDNEEVRKRLDGVCDAYLHHNRPILRPADDSVVRVIAGRPRRLRIGRGLGPLELTLPAALPAPALAVGGHMKNTVALAWDRRVVVSPHIGDLDSPRSLAVFRQVIDDLCRLYRVEPRLLLCDAHPNYTSTRWARRQAEESGYELRAIYHHHAHAGSVAGEFPEERRWLVFTWDGTGLGADGNIWGGEALLGRPGDWRRVGSVRPFRLPGGEKAGREPWRSAAALAWEEGYDWSPPQLDTGLIRQAWQRRINSPVSSAVGRLFDAGAALSGLIETASFEGQGPMLLEASALTDERLPEVTLELREDADGVLRLDWAPLTALALNRRLSSAARALAFHHALAEGLVAQARELRRRHGDFAVGLAGGVFQNRLLAERVLERLQAEGLRAYLPVAIPCNDAGLAYGQVIEALAGAGLR